MRTISYAIALIIGFCFLHSTFAVDQVALTSSPLLKTKSNYTYYECPAIPAIFCRDDWYRGCLCYKNGTCDTTWVNRCESCKNKDVFSINEGQECPNQWNPEGECGVIPKGAAVRCATERQLSCVCYTNGTCEEKQANSCVDCQQVFTESVLPGKCQLPVKNDICTKEERGVQCFHGRTVEGCRCTAPGKCEYTWVNRCTDCSSKQNYLVAEGKRCEEDDTRYLCPRADNLNKKTCKDEWYRGCRCYNNGTCGTTWINECQTCKDSKVYSIDIGKSCPGQEMGEHECFLVSPFLAIDCFFPKTQPSCVCYSNGTCVNKEADSCRDCQQKFTESIAPGEDCNGKKYEYFVPQRCKFDPKLVRCSSEKKKGCLCYANNTCVEASSNHCMACVSGAVSFNEGEQCPKNQKNFNICPVMKEDETFDYSKCDGEDYVTGCACSDEGECAQEYYQPCSRCSWYNTAYIIPGGKCPAKKNTTTFATIAKNVANHVTNILKDVFDRK